MAYVVSEEFRNKEYSGESEFKGRLVIGNETVPNEQISKITIEDYIFDSSSQENNGVFYIGTFIAQKVTVKFKNLNGLDLHSGDNAQLYISQYVGNEWVEIPMGTYQIDDLAENYQETCEIDLLDNSVKFKTNIDYSPCFVDDKANIDTILEYVCEQCGVELGTYPSINGYIETGQFDSEISGKRWISYIAELKGSNAKIGRDGHLYLIPLKHEHTVSINALESASWKLGEKYEISRVRFDNGVILYEKGNETNNTLYLRQDNPFILSQEAVDNIYESLLTSGEEETKEGTSIDLDLVDDVNVGTFTLYGNTSQGTNLLPAAYTQVEYIQSSGTQYIDTGVNADNNMSIEIDMQFNEDSASNYNNTFGAITLREGTSNSYFRYHINPNDTNNINIAYHTGTNQTLVTTGYTKRFKTFIDMYNKTWQTVVDGVKTNGTFTYTSFDTGITFWLFRRNSATESLKYYSKSKIYHCKIFYSGTLVRDFIPCYKNSNNAIGLYDLVNNIFYTNLGTGTFTKGDNYSMTPTPEYPQEIKTFNGNNSINITSKNMYNYIDSFVASVNGLTNTLNSDGSITTTGVPTANYRMINNAIDITDLLEDGQKYTISQKEANTYLYIQINLARRDGGATEYIGTKNSKSYTFTVNKSVYSLYSIRIQTTSTSEWGTNSRTITNFYQLEKGEQATDFEAYKKRSYNINLPAVNLLNSATNTDGYFINQNGVITSTQNGHNYTALMPVFTGKYTFSGIQNRLNASNTKRIHGYDANGNWIKQITSFGVRTTTAPVNYSQTFTLSDANVKYIRLSYYDDDTYCQFEKGSVANSYNEYGNGIELCKIDDYKDTIIYNINTRNIIPTDITDWESGHYDTSGNKTTNSTRIRLINLLPVQPNTTYYNGQYKGLILRTYDSSKTFVRSIGVLNTNETLTTNSNEYYLGISIDGTMANFYNYLTFMCLNSEQDKSYQPYYDGWYIKKEIEKIVLNGSESWVLHNSSSTRTIFRIAISNKIPYTNNANTPKMICSHFNPVPNNATWVVGNLSEGSGSTNVYFAVEPTYTLDTFENWLSTHNTILYYVLANPTYKKITDETLISQLDNSQDAILYKGINHISQTNNDLSSYLQLDYAGQNQFEMYSLQTRNYGDISLDAWDIIDYELGDETYSTYNNRKLTFEMSIMSDTNVQISNKQQEETTNMIGGSTATQTRKLKTTVNALDNKIDIEVEDINTSLTSQEGRVSNLEISANNIATSVSSLQTLTNEQYNTLNNSLNDYKILTDDELGEINSKFDDYATKSDLITIQNSVNSITTDTYTKTEVNTLLVDGSVKKLQTTSATLDENGMTYAKTNAPTSSNINERGLTIIDNSNNPVLRAVYDDTIKNSIVDTYRHQVHEYFIMGNHSRFEDYEDGTGCFDID